MTGLSASIEFASHISINIRQSDNFSKDPLVLNFNGTMPSLTDEKIRFDIDCDGYAELSLYDYVGNQLYR
ncbi:MAG: hypothetical protein NUV45_14100 [Tepidanaerobacteraceae bacterium]|nr:hypothetical protein [Tepidanaerobacteraceae bacterium]